MTTIPAGCLACPNPACDGGLVDDTFERTGRRNAPARTFERDCPVCGAFGFVPSLALTVRPPWSWAIIHAGKLVENRSRGALGWRRHVGSRLWVHTAATWSDRGAHDHRIITAWLDAHPDYEHRGIRQVPRNTPPPGWLPGHVIGHVELEDVHLAAGCCEPWGESTYTEGSGRLVTDVVHLVLADPVALAEPVPAMGRLGLWPFTLEAA